MARLLGLLADMACGGAGSIHPSWELGHIGEREVRRRRCVGSTGDVDRHSEGGLQMVFCCITRRESERLCLGEQREQRRHAGSLPGLLRVS